MSTFAGHVSSQERRVGFETEDDAFTVFRASEAMLGHVYRYDWSGG
jgi:hypothetical protein